MAGAEGDIDSHLSAVGKEILPHTLTLFGIRGSSF